MALALSPAYVAWLECQGVEICGITAAFVDDGWRGISAVKELAAGDLLLKVPENILLSSHSARRDPVLSPALLRHGENLTSFQVLAIHLLHELSKGTGSKWAPYLQQLPRQYTTLACFSQDDAAALQVQEALELANEAREDARGLWRSALPVLRALELPKKWLSLQAWLWATATLTSRTMFAPFDPAVGVLTPFGDLHNYEPPPAPVTPDIPELRGVLGAQERTREGTRACGGDGHFCAETADYRLYARRAYKKGEQVYLCYGTYTNLELLQHYGFILSDNPHDTASLPLALLRRHSAEALALVRHELRAADAGQTRLHLRAPASRCGKEEPTRPLELLQRDSWLHVNGVPSWELLKALRLYAATPDERKRHSFDAAAGHRISLAGDAAAFRAIRETCGQLLESYPTSLEEDETLAAGLGPEEDCRKLAITWRCQHKRILQRGMKAADVVLLSLRLQP